KGGPGRSPRFAWRLPSVLQRDVRPRRRAHILTPRTDQAVVLALLDRVRCPADNATGDEERRIEVDLETQILVEPGARPVEIRGEPFFFADDALNRVGNLFERRVAGRAGQVGTEIPQDDRPRV